MSEELLSWLERQLEGCLSYAMEIGDVRHTPVTRALERDLQDALKQIRHFDVTESVTSTGGESDDPQLLGSKPE